MPLDSELDPADLGGEFEVGGGSPMSAITEGEKLESELVKRASERARFVTNIGGAAPRTCSTSWLSGSELEAKGSSAQEVRLDERAQSSKSGWRSPSTLSVSCFTARSGWSSGTR